MPGLEISSVCCHSIHNTLVQPVLTYVPRFADFLESESIANGSTRRVHIFALWTVLIEGLAPIWPATRTTFGGVPLGDVWPCDALKPTSVNEGDELVPFHKLTGWITYSLIEPIQTVLGWDVEGLEHMTGLPEYRNGVYISLPTSYRWVSHALLQAASSWIWGSSHSGPARLPPRSIPILTRASRSCRPRTPLLSSGGR